MGYLQHLTEVSIIYTHTHTHKLYIYLHIIMHVSTRACYIHHKRGITEVWHMVHFWVSHGRCTMPGSPMGRSEGLSRRWACYVPPARNTKKNAPLHASRALIVVLLCLDHP